MISNTLIRHIIENPPTTTGWRGKLKAPFELLDEYAVNNFENLPTEIIKKIQLNKIKNTIENAYKNVPFWRNHLEKVGIHPNEIQKLEDLHKIPVVTRKELKKSTRSYSWTEKTNKNFLGRTSGSTGEPFVFYNDPSGLLRNKSIYLRNIRTANSSPNISIVRILVNNLIGLSSVGNFVSASGPSDIEAKKEELFILLKKENTLIEGIPSHIFYLAKLVKEAKISTGVIGVIVAGEHLAEGERDFISKTFNCRVNRAYGTRELNRIAQSCNYDDSLHINTDWLYLEIVDNSGERVPEGETGRIIATTFENRITPLIRYDFGDIGCVIKEPCPCGNLLPRVNIRGRSADKIILSNGEYVHAFEFTRIFNELHEHIMQYQIIQKADGNLEVLIVPRGVLKEEDFQKIQKTFTQKTRNEISVTLTITDKTRVMPSGKRPVFIKEY